MRRLALVTVILVLMLTGCVPSQPTIDPRTGEGLAASTAWFQSLSPDEQLKVAARQDTESERQLWKDVGLDDALGGEQAADEAFGAMQDAIRTRHDAVRDDGPAFEFASAVASGFDEAAGAGMYGNMTIGDLLNQAAMEQTRSGEDGSDTSRLSEDTTASLASQDGTVTTRYDTQTTIKGVRLELQVKSQITPCPDANGNVHAEGTYTLRVSGPDGHGLITEVTVTDDIQVGDDAEKAGSTFSYYAEYSDNKSGDGIIAYGVDANGEAQVGSGDSASAQGQTAAMKNGSFFAGWIALSLERAAEKGWQDGRCVQLDVSYSDGPGGLDPGAEVNLTVSPVAKSDHAPAGGTVTAKLASGATSIDPEGRKVKANAAFTYIAPGERDKEGTVHLEARSKRGVGILDVTLDTKSKAYLISGGGGELSFSGQTCDISQPFAISGKGLTLSFTPTGLTAGSYTISGFAGATWSGGGSYDITLTDTGGSMTTSGNYTVTSPVGKFTKAGKMNFTLTPIKKCS
jgi:hypothetical protein